MQRFSLTYTTPSGGVVQLWNLGASARDEIIAVQRQLGSTGFAITPQRRDFSQLDIELMTRRGDRL